MLTLVDAHVHVHPASDLAALLDAAAANFAAQARALRAEAWEGVLMLTETSDAAWFEGVQSSGKIVVGAWVISPHASDALALWASVGGRRILIVAGRQIVTGEGVEVLALATRAAFRDGATLEATLASARAAGALVVLPWAVGKWLGRRGSLVDAAISGDPSCPFAGDNGGRPFFWPSPSLFARERSRGRPVISGSDLLAIRGDERRAGSFGFHVATSLDPERPAARLRDVLLSATAAEVMPFGRLQGPVTFFRNQLGLRLARRGARPTSKPPSGERPEWPDVETSSAAYARRFAGAAGRYLLDVQAATVRRALAGLPPGRALDVGGGHGQLVPLLRGLGWDVTVHGTDARCGRNLRELHGFTDVPFIEGDLHRLPVADGSFDLVLAVRLISHVDDWQGLIAELCRVARRAVVIDYPSTGGANALGPLLFGFKKSLEGNTRSYTSFSRPVLEDAFGRHGFRCTRELKQFVLPMVLHRVGRAAWPLRAAEGLSRAVGLTSRLGSPVILRVDRR
jgi:SAM-dependent methyltransferase